MARGVWSNIVGGINMTFEKLKNIILQNNIPEDVKLLSDSGWECGETEMNGIFYNKQLSHIIFTQTGDKYDQYHKNKQYICLHNVKEK